MGPSLVVVAQDLSETGARLVLTARLEPGQEVEVLLHGQGLARPLKRLARVMSSQARETGRWLTRLRFDRALPYPDMQSLSRVSL